MLDYGITGGGNSSLSLSRNSKGDYTWDLKLYFLGNDLRTIKQMIAKIGKARGLLEHILGQKIVPAESMSAYLKKLEAEVETAVIAQAEGKGNDGKQANANK